MKTLIDLGTINYMRENHFHALKDLTASFYRGGNIVSQEKAKIERAGEYKISVSIADGNHSKDFDMVIITDENDIPIIQMSITYDEFIHGFGTLNVFLSFTA